MPLYMVLSDGETYTNLEGCKIVRVSADVSDMGDLDILDEVVKYADHPESLEAILSEHGEPVTVEDYVSVIARF